MHQDALLPFGYNSLRQNNVPARGLRPLVVILAEYSEYPPFNTFHPLEYYEKLGFGNPLPPLTTRTPVNPGSLSEYFAENSSGRFTFSRAGLIGPLAMGPFGTDPGPEERSAKILRRAAAEQPEIFNAVDANGNRTIAADEMCVMLFENLPLLQPANRDNNAASFTIHRPFGDVTKTILVHVAAAGPLTPFYQIAHELSHSLGTADMYNSGLGNYLLTLMGGYSFYSDDQLSVHLDIWHKLRLGWAEPRIFPLSSPGSAVVDTGTEGAILLWHPSRGAHDYFLLERRQKVGGSLKYDRGVSGDGVLIWQVRQNAANGVRHLGAPALQYGSSGVWKAGDQTPMLPWPDGHWTDTYISFGDAGSGRMKVAWGGRSLFASSSRHKRLFYGGNGTSPVDSGLPDVGIFFGVRESGELDWNRYNGQGQVAGEPVPAGNWHLHTGHRIGRGWGEAEHLLGCGDGVILGIFPGGLLHWYRYTGNGEMDPSGTFGWHPNSGNAIGNGWQGLRHVLVFPSEGRSGRPLTMLTVSGDGALRWYAYSGDGTSDPSGTLGWHPNSGNRIGRGWGDFIHLHGAGNTIFGVLPDGALRWYAYTGAGEADPSGSLGWQPNSGNQIGRGWNGMAHIFGGSNDIGGFGNVIMAVDPDGDLHWYKYTGNGEHDPTGSLNWAPRSGNRIGSNW